MFHDWADFYIIVGASAGALIGTMFVVATLTAGLTNTQTTQGARTYITPIVFHFSIVVVVSSIAGIPAMPSAVAGFSIAGCAALGFLYSVATTVRLYGIKRNPEWSGALPDFSDKWFYGFMPSLIYIALGATAAYVWVDDTAASYSVGVLMLIPLLMGIRDAWDLATALVSLPRDKQG